ncbi:MAG: hypothetical protein ACTSXT_08130 [Candidatus Helarchaeota archaeon]
MQIIYLSVLVFHHKNPKLKKFGISHSGVIKSWKKTKVELDKCMLLCRNCHAEIYANLL